MKHSKTTKVMALMLSLVMITSVFVGNTLSRYVTSVSSTDNARVAVWGINAGEDTVMNLFDTKYLVDDKEVAKANDNGDGTFDKIMAPGAKGEAPFSIINFEQDVAPEVAYEVKISLDDSEIHETIKNNPSVQWKLDNGAFGTWNELKISILSLSGNAAGRHVYGPGEFATAFQGTQEHKIAWQWIMDNNNNLMDTEMGNLALANDLNAVIKVSITAQQIDDLITNEYILDGADQTVNLNYIEPISIRSSADFSTFQGVEVNDQPLTRDVDYTAEEGSTVITLTEEYLSSLTVGTYTIDIISDDVTATTKFTVTDEMNLININTVMFWENDGISRNTGLNIPSPSEWRYSRLRMKEYLPGNIINISSNTDDNYYFEVYLYDKETDEFYGKLHRNGDIVIGGSQCSDERLDYFNVREYINEYKIRIVLLRYDKDEVELNIDIKNVTDNYSLNIDDNLIHDTLTAEQIVVKKIANVLTDTTYVPIRDLPKSYSINSDSQYFKAGEEMKGFPYSAVYEKEGLIGYDVSVETFLTAIKNPNSILYTEKLNFNNSGVTRYGMVCSSFSGLAIGNKYFYHTAIWDKIENNELIIDDITPENLNDIKIGDTLWIPGHVLVITDILRDEHKNVKFIELSTAERRIFGTIDGVNNTAVSKSLRRLFSVEQLMDYLTFYNDHAIYRNNLTNIYPADMLEVPSNYNEELMLDKGNKSNYKYGENVEFTMYDTASKPYLLLYKDGEKTPSKVYDLNVETLIDGYNDENIAPNKIFVISNLDIGKYKAVLSTKNTVGGNESEEVEFIVCDLKINVTASSKITIDFESNNCIPIFVAWRNGGDLATSILEVSSISSENLQNGYVVLDKSGDTITVYAENEFGRISEHYIIK